MNNEKLIELTFSDGKPLHIKPSFIKELKEYNGNGYVRYGEEEDAEHCVKETPAEILQKIAEANGKENLSNETIGTIISDYIDFELPENIGLYTEQYKIDCFLSERNKSNGK